MIRDGLRFFRWNFQHYSLALWGLRLRFDPPYPMVLKFFPSLISEPVFEYRTYGLMVLFCYLLARFLPLEVLIALIVLWFGVSLDRCKYLKSNLVFWRQVLRENGTGHHRSQGRYIEQLIRETERCMKAGLPWQDLSEEAFRLQDEVISRYGWNDRAKAILAGK